MCHKRKTGRKRCRVGTMSLATSCDITRHHAIGSGSGSGAGGVRCHSTEGVAEERRGGGSGSGRQAGVGSGSGRWAGIGSVRGFPYINPLEKRPIQILEFAGKGGNSYFNTVEMSKWFHDRQINGDLLSWSTSFKSEWNRKRHHQSGLSRITLWTVEQFRIWLRLAKQ